MPEVSIIVPAYNAERFLDKCLRSIVAQTFSDFELIVINDGSTDTTGEICARWVERDARIRLLSQVNSGLAAVRNVGLAEASGAYVMFVDSDDWIEPYALEELYVLLRRTGVQIAMGRYVEELPDGTLMRRPRQVGDCVLSGDEAFRHLLFSTRVQSYSWAKLYDGRLFEGLRYPEGELLEDYKMASRLYARALRVASTSRCVYHYVQHDASIMHAQELSPTVRHAFLSLVGDRYSFAISTGLLSTRDRELLRVKSVKRIVREVRTLRREFGSEVVRRGEFLAGRSLELIMGREVPPSEYERLYRWAKRRKVFVQLFHFDARLPIRMFRIRSVEGARNV